MRRRIFIGMVLITLFSVILSSFLTGVIIYNNFELKIKTELETKAVYIKTFLDASDEKYLYNLSDTVNRITLIDTDGTVLFDNQADAETMENHGDRPEVLEAMEKGVGSDTRESDTLYNVAYYYAMRLEDGRVLRVSGTMKTIYGSLNDILPWIIFILLMVIFVSAFLAKYLTRVIVEPINNIDLDKPQDNIVYDEITPLLTRIDRQNLIITKQMEELELKQKEFSTITENMHEGFLVIDKNTNILSYNSSAIRLLGLMGTVNAEPMENFDSYNGLSVLTLNRSESFIKAVEKSLKGEHIEESLRTGNKFYHLIANPVYSDDGVAGAVIVILDVTEKEQWETLRREFTTNVSHELKTPLTSISGYAEIIKAGIAKDSDIKRFAGKIYDETQRLASLVNDVLKLSQLDEKTIPYEKEPIDLYELSEEIIEHLSDTAAKRNISFELEGVHAKVEGVYQILDEMIYNLCDNAIKYNKEKGKIKIKIFESKSRVKISVSDTGIGIPEEHHSRIFERFYRVDKSHSKEIGGTGLGLSIVKHGASFHNAVISLDSKEGLGTTISIYFNKE